MSVIVITYNSSEYIEECLGSVLCQTYQEIQLIVTDDCSSDNTVPIVKKWLERHHGRFVSSRLVESSVNTGVASNCNRGLKESSGEWLKFIAGDDMLVAPGCISDFVESIPKKENVGVLFSYEYKLKDGEMILNKCPYENIFFNKVMTAERQFRVLIKKNFLPAPAAFVKAHVLKRIGGYDESIPMCEDAVLWINMTQNGYALELIKKPLVIYRMHGGSLVDVFHRGVNIRIISDQIKILERIKIPNHHFLFKLHFKSLRLLLKMAIRMDKHCHTIANIILFIYRFNFNFINNIYFLMLKLRVLCLRQ